MSRAGMLSDDLSEIQVRIVSSNSRNEDAKMSNCGVNLADQHESNTRMKQLSQYPGYTPLDRQFHTHQIQVIHLVNYIFWFFQSGG